MSKKFNLLLLHSPMDVHPRTWICLKGVKLRTIFKKLEREVIKNRGWCREKLSREIANRLHCCHNTIKRVLRRESEFYPIPIILKLLRYSKNKKKFLKKFKKNIEYLKVNSASAKVVKAVYKLNENLAKILGAFMADGSLSIQVVFAAPNLKDLKEVKSKLKRLKICYSIGYAPSRNQYYVSIRVNKNNYKLLNKVCSSHRYLTQTHYGIELSDEYRDNVEAFVKWIKDEFDINPNRFEKRGNAWRVSFSNKILARYLMTFFKIKPGPKTSSAFEPKIIETSNLNTRKAFARGVLMFDGCVSIDKKILLSVRSKNLLNSIGKIWKEDKINFGKATNCKRKEKTLFTTAENRKEKLLEYFEENTQKWKLLKWLSGDLTQTPVSKYKSSLSLEKVLKVLQKIKCCDAIFLKNYFKCSHSIVRTYLKILRDQGKIRLTNRPRYINECVDKNAMVLLKNKFHTLVFKEIREKFKKDKNFAEFLKVNKATLSAWRVRKNRIPLYVLEKMCRVLNINFNRISRNIIKTDREIAEVI